MMFATHLELFWMMAIDMTTPRPMPLKKKETNETFLNWNVACTCMMNYRKYIIEAKTL